VILLSSPATWHVLKGVWSNAGHESAQQERQMSKGNREKKKPKADKSKLKPAAAATPFGAASNAGKAAGKRK
jgi:hypothetical protein